MQMNPISKMQVQIAVLNIQNSQNTQTCKSATMDDVAVAPTETTKVAKATETKKPATAKRAKTPMKKTVKKATKAKMNATANGAKTPQDEGCQEGH